MNLSFTRPHRNAGCPASYLGSWFFGVRLGYGALCTGCRRCRSGNCRRMSWFEGCDDVLLHSCSPGNGMEVRYISVPFVGHECIVTPRDLANGQIAWKNRRYARFSSRVLPHFWQNFASTTFLCLHTGQVFIGTDSSEVEPLMKTTSPIFST